MIFCLFLKLKSWKSWSSHRPTPPCLTRGFKPSGLRAEPHPGLQANSPALPSMQPLADQSQGPWDLHATMNQAMKPPDHLGGCVWTASHTFQCSGHEPALGPLAKARALSPDEVSREENPQKQANGRRKSCREQGTRPQRQREKRRREGWVSGVWRETTRASEVGWASRRWGQGRPGLGVGVE